MALDALNVLIVAKIVLERKNQVLHELVMHSGKNALKRQKHTLVHD